MKTNYITTTIILVLLLIFCNIYITIDEKIIEGQDETAVKQFNCNDIIEDYSCNDINYIYNDISYITTPSTTNDIINNNNSTLNIKLTDISNNINTITTDLSVNIDVSNNLFCEFYKRSMNQYVFCHNSNCYNTPDPQQQFDNTFNNPTNRILSISSRGIKNLTVFRDRIIYFKQILSRTIVTLIDIKNTKIKNDILQKLEDISGTLQIDINKINNNNNLLTKISNNQSISPYITESFDNFLSTLDYNCDKICDYKYNNSNFTCNDCKNLYSTPGNADNNLETINNNIHTAIKNFVDNISTTISDINTTVEILKSYIAEYIRVFNNFINNNWNNCLENLSGTNIYTNNTITELSNISGDIEFNQWNSNRIISVNLPQLNYTNFTSTKNTYNNYHCILRKIQLNFVSLNNKVHDNFIDKIDTLLTFLKSQHNSINKYVNNIECIMKTSMYNLENNESNQNFSLLDNFSDNLLVPNIFTIFKNVPGTNMFSGIDAAKIFGSIIPNNSDNK